MTITSEFLLVCGVGRAVGDEDSAERSRRVFDLLQTNIAGFSVPPEGWSPAQAQLKGGGAWADSALTDGRSLVASAVTNVIETITLTSQAATPDGRFALERKLAEFARWAREFWTTEAQIEPVYLHWRAFQACEAQYAILYNIDIAPNGDPFSDSKFQEITVTLEREPYWRAVPPGANPKLYLFQAMALRPGLDFDLTNLSLWRGVDHLVATSVENRHEWDPADYVTPLSKNYIDIPGENIPGDAPALCCITVRADRNLMVARSTKKHRYTNRADESFAAASMLNAGDAALGSGDATKQISATEGVYSNGSSATRYRVHIDFSAEPDEERLTWGTDAIKLDVNTLRGKYLFMARARKVEAESSVVTLQLRIQMVNVAGTANINQTLLLPQVRMTSEGFSYATWYLGAAEIPFDNRTISSPEGYGLEVGSQSDVTIRFLLDVTSSEVTTDVDVLDLIMLPYDEALSEALISFGDGDGVPDRPTLVVLDGTGYTDHGRSVWGGRQYFYDTVAETLIGSGVPIEVRGTPITLLPGADNRLYFFGTYYAPDDTFPTELKSEEEDSYEVRLNIVPRWSGVRDDCLSEMVIAATILTDDAGVPLTDDALTYLEDA